MQELYVFITHHFEEPFLSFIKDFPPQQCVILFDYSSSKDIFPNIEIPIVKIERIPTSYDQFGHSMFISFLRQNPNLVKKYNYIWIIENDVYVPFKINGNKTFMDMHRSYTYDLMVPEYGVRKIDWCWFKTLKGFEEIKPVGITGVIMRMSQRLIKKLLLIDKDFSGYMEAVLPCLCNKHGFSIQCFLPEYIGKVTTDREDSLLRQIMKNPELKEEKIYHPYKY
jgi:hypothetical protein